MSKRGFGAHVYPGCRDATGTRAEEKTAKWIEDDVVPEGCKPEETREQRLGALLDGVPDELPNGHKLEVIVIEGQEFLQIVPCPDLSDVMRALGEILERVKRLEEAALERTLSGALPLPRRYR